MTLVKRASPHGRCANDPRFTRILMYLVVGDNEPRSVTDASDYTIPVRGEQRGLHHVAIEIRQTLVPQTYQRVVAVPQAADELLSTTKEALHSAKPR
jgi:predicted N-formylglutamate amidohydrolase